MAGPFWFQSTCGSAQFGFTDASTDLGRGPVAAHGTAAGVMAAVDALGGGEPVLMRQVHGVDVAVADPATPAPVADALIVDRPGIVAIVRVADCVPVVMIAADGSLGAVVHAGRVGMTAGVVPAAVKQLRSRGARDLRAWIGPRACGQCYEVPDEMADAVAAVEPSARSVTRQGTAGLDLGAAVAAQLARDGVEIHDLGGCTIEDERFWSHRRQADAAGRFGAALVLRAAVPR